MLSGLAQRLWMGRKCPREQAEEGGVPGTHLPEVVECSSTSQLGLYSHVLAGVDHSVTSTEHLT